MATSIIKTDEIRRLNDQVLMSDGVLKSVEMDGIKLKSSGSSITKSDGTTPVLSESGGAVTIIADEVNVGSNALIVNSNGNVGIGIDTPRTILEVNGLLSSAGYYSGYVPGTMNNNSGAVIIHCFDATRGLQFDGDFIVNSYTGNRFLTLHITARYNTDNVEWTKVADSSHTNTGKVNVTLSTITVGSFNYLALRKSGGYTGATYLNAIIKGDFIAGDYNAPIEIQSGDYTVVTDHVTF